MIQSRSADWRPLSAALSICMAVVITAMACVTEPTPNPGGPACDAQSRGGTMSVAVDGVAWSSAFLDSWFSCSTLAGPPYQLAVSYGHPPDNNLFIGLRTPGPMATGTYPVSCDNPTQVEGRLETFLPTTVDKQWKTCPGGSGHVTLSLMTKTRLMGGFQFTIVPADAYPNTTGTRVVSGSFDLRF